METCAARRARPAPVDSAARFRAWLGQAEPGAVLAYHQGHLIWDRSPTSDLASGERRVVARLADAALQAADDGRVHLVQRRHGPFDFSYLAIKVRVPVRRHRSKPLTPAADDLPVAA